MINPKAQGMLDRSRNRLSRNSLGPVAIRQEIVDDINIESSRIRADQEFTKPDFVWMFGAG
jgi:hypothetical protein